MRMLKIIELHAFDDETLVQKFDKTQHRQFACYK